MKVLVFISLWVISVAAYDKVSSRDCGTGLSSVRMEVSPTLLQVICSNNNQTTLVVDSGSSIRYEKVTGFCNSFDLNIGHVLMNQPLMSSTVTLQLVKSGQILDAARVAILKSEHLFHYRISVWGNRNTRFVLAIEKGCAPYQYSDMSDTPERDLPSSVVKSSRHVPLVHLNGQLPAFHYNTDTALSRMYPYYVRDDELPGVPEYLRPNKLANVEHDNYAFLKIPKLQLERRDTSHFEDNPTKVEIYRSKVSRPDSSLGGDHLHQSDEDYGEDDVMTTTPESSELAKLRWMEEKRILFEQRMKFLRNFYSESGDTTDNENPSADEADEKIGVGILKETANNFPASLDSNRGVNEPSSSADLNRLIEDVQNTETPPGDHDQKETRRSENLQLGRQESTVRNEEHTRLEYRQLSHSDASLDSNSDMKSEFIRRLYPFDKSVLNNDIPSSHQTQEPMVNNNYRNFSSEENKNKKVKKVEVPNINTSSLQTVQKPVIGDKLLSILKEQMENNMIPVNNTETLSDAKEDVVKSSSSIQSSTKSNIVTDVIYNPTFTRSNYHPQDVTEATPGDRFSQMPILSRLHNTNKDYIGNTKSTTIIGNPIPTLSSTVGQILHKVTSQLKDDFQHNLRSSTDNAITETLVKDTTTATSLQLSTQTELPTTSSQFLSHSTSDKLNSRIQNVITNIDKETYAPLTSPTMNSLHSSTEQLKKIKYSISSAYVVSTPFTKIPTLASSLPNERDPVILTTSQSFAHSAPLEVKLASSREPPIHYEVPIIVDKTASLVSTGEPPREAEKHTLGETATKSVLRAYEWKENNTDLLQNNKGKAIQLKDRIRSFLILSNDTAQASATSSSIITKVPSVILKRESHVSSIVKEESNFTEASLTLDTLTEQTKTTVSFEQETTSSFQTNTGTSQGGENEPQEMGEDSFWPIVAALVIGVPAIVVLVIAITVIHKKRLEDPARQACLQIIHATANA